MRGVVGLLCCAVALVSCRPSHVTPATEVIPWAWERPEDLRFAPVKRVAYLAATLELTNDDVRVQYRMQPLRIRPGTAVIPVIRIETDRRSHPSLTRRQAAEAIESIVALPAVRAADEVQIDFDAVYTQRQFYRDLLIDLRSAIGTKRLSITALASWCMDDPWLRGLPIDDAIPMLFEMGRDAPVIRARLARGEDFKVELCRHSVGISTSEPPESVPRGRTMWVFSKTAWSRAEWRKAQEQIGGWQ